MEKQRRLTATIVGPTGTRSKRIEAKIPIEAHKTERTAAQIVTPRKLLHSRMADRAGKIIRAEMSREPTKFMAKTMITAVMIATKKL